MINRSQELQPKTRVIPFGRRYNEGKFTNNQIFTTKYSYLSFVPHAILLQFIYPRNFIFLANAILQSIRAISNLSPWTAILPLIVVIFISVLREGWQDYKRRKRDWATNLKQAYVLRNGTFVQDVWQNISVGDYVAVLKNQQIPADLILLQSSDSGGAAYIETSNLDGEANLKQKTAIFQNNKLYPAQLEQLQGVAEVEEPNIIITSFDGKVLIDQKYSIPLSIQNLLLRGTSLKNTEQVIGIVVYTGMDTKIMKNLGNVRNKINRFETMINWIQLVLGIFLFFMVLTCGLLYWRYWRNTNGSQGVFYLFRVRHYGVHGEAAFAALSSFILLNTIIPLSLNISLDLIAAFQSDVFEYDIRMSHWIQNKRIYCTVNNSRTIPQLGIVSFVLTDKTGTLTTNQMQFRRLFVQNRIYNCQQMLNSRMNNGGGFSKFWFMVLVCNEVIIDHQKNIYQGSSPDEICLMNFASQIGYKLLKRQKNRITILIHGQQKTVEIVRILSFDARKMMSVIFKDPSTQQYILSIKGADSQILKRVGNQSSYQKQSYSTQTDDFSRSGLRTLLFAQRSLNPSEVNNLLQQLTNLKQRRFRGQITQNQYLNLYGDSIRQIQSGLSLLGATAIEDKLQEGVSESIRNLRMAGIQIAMITGDKLQTAESIGKLSNFIDTDSQTIRISEESIPEQQIDTLIQKIRNGPKSSQNSLIIEGKAIVRYINHPVAQFQQTFADVISKCSSVIFCRASPFHKGLIAMFYKKYYQGVVVAIGDGGNDVRMIQEADIGIGIVGVEGNQASSAADFSIPRFRFIERLILHHGRWVLFRMAFFFNYYGFKVTILTIILFCYLAYSGFTGTSLLPNAYLAAYNSVLTVVLPISYAVYQHDISADLYGPASYYLPLMYKDSKRLQLFSYWRFTLWTLAGIVYAVWLFFTTYYVLDSRTATDNHGRIPDQMSVAMNIQMSLYIFVTSIIIMQIRAYNIWMWFLVLFLTIIISIIFFIIQNYAYVDDAYQALTNNFNLRFWLLIIINSAFGTIIRYIMLALNFSFWPSSVEIAILQRNYLPQPLVQRHGHHYNQLEFKSFALTSSTSLM